MGEVGAILRGLTPAEAQVVTELGRDLVHSAGRRVQAEGIPLPRGAEVVRRAIILALSACIFADPDPNKTALTLEAANRVLQGQIDG